MEKDEFSDPAAGAFRVNGFDTEVFKGRWDGGGGGGEKMAWWEGGRG